MAKPKVKRKVRCLSENCSNDPYIRGLCRACYASAWRMVRDGDKTWIQLEEEGACLGTKKNPFREQWE